MVGPVKDWWAEWKLDRAVPVKRRGRIQRYAGAGSGVVLSAVIVIGALLVSGGPLLGAGLAVAARRHTGPARTAAVLAGAAALTIALADLSRMSKAEVERI